MEPEIRIYQKENSLHFGRLLSESLKDIVRSRFLSRQWAIRDIQATYRQSYFGILWAFITPLATALVWVVLNQSGTIRLSDTGIPYPIYALSGTLIWSMISEAINAPLSSTNAAKNVLSKINFPKEALIISGIYKLLFNSLVKIFLLVVFVFVYGVGYHHSLLLFPLALVGALFFGTTVGLIITPFGMLYKDVSRIITVGMQFLMYVTPVVYMIPESGILKTLMEWNPITYLVLTGRQLLTGMELMHLSPFFWVVLACVPIFLIALVFYRISIPIIVERQGN